MEDFYNIIKELEKKYNEPIDEKKVLEKHKKELFELITENYKDNIQNAVIAGNDKAYLCIYRADAKYNESIFVHDLLFASDIIKEKSAKLEITLLMDDINEYFRPFKISLNSANEDTFMLLVAWN